ncbi:MAG: heme A synthase [Gemmatimonadota bacterium]|nr:MAG: heme A synthase [Gemmatimonadota bacterium]
MKTLRYLSYSAAILAYALVVLGGVVRITGSGMGCGDDWPLCNGHLIPPLDDYRTFLEWGHRQVAALLSLLTLAVVVQALRTRREPGGSGPGGTLLPAVLAGILLLIQVMLGAVTVWLELPPASVIAHLGVAMAFIAAMMITGFRADTSLEPCGPVPKRGAITSAAVMAGAVILLGGLTANLDAGPACLGFPLCNGRLWPGSGSSGLPHIHWTHRLVAYALFLHLLGMTFRFRKLEVPARVKDAVWYAFAVSLTQVVIGAVMVLTFVTGGPLWRVLHVAAGTALWAVLVYATWLVTDKVRSPSIP